MTEPRCPPRGSTGACPGLSNIVHRHGRKKINCSCSSGNSRQQRHSICSSNRFLSLTVAVGFILYGCSITTTHAFSVVAPTGGGSRVVLPKTALRCSYSPSATSGCGLPSSRRMLVMSPRSSSFAGMGLGGAVMVKRERTAGRAETTVIGRGRRALVMGIPKLFRWLTDQYPAINQRLDQKLNERTAPFDNLYLDMNGVIHMCTHANDDEFVELNEAEMFRRIFIFTDRLFKLIKPRRLMYLAVDGTAPRAKMNQQRSRRFRSSKEAEQIMGEILQREGKLPNFKRFDSNCITPGTDFMFKLSKAFRAWIPYKMETDPFWQENARVVFSGPDVPGEGEHKVMDYIRQARETEPDWRDDLRHCLYGLDADLIMLGLVTHEQHFTLLREKMTVRRATKKKPKDPITYTHNDFELLEVSLLREMLRLQFQATKEDTSLPFNFEIERIIDDFVFMCILVGNDFLPNTPHLDIAEGDLSHMMNIYKLLLPKMGGYLTDKDKIHHGRLEMFLHEVSRREAMYFRQRGLKEEDLSFQSPEKYKDHYYLSKLGLTPEDVDEKRLVCQHYLEGLYWVLKYYHLGVDAGGSWSWFYPHLYAPLASEMRDLMEMDISFEKGRPFPNLLQLLSVLPPQSANELPEQYRKLMTDPLSPILHYYPLDFECDTNGKRQSWEAVVKIPFIDETKVFDALSKVDHATDLTLVDRLRNCQGQVWQYVPQYRLTSPGEMGAGDPPLSKVTGTLPKKNKTKKKKKND